MVFQRKRKVQDDIQVYPNREDRVASNQEGKEQVFGEEQVLRGDHALTSGHMTFEGPVRDLTPSRQNGAQRPSALQLHGVRCQHRDDI